jgi:hypothetical protein
MLLVIASALSLPFTNLMFSFPLLMGNEAEDFSMWDLLGVLGSMAGFLMYSLVPNQDGDFMPVCIITIIIGLL